MDDFISGLKGINWFENSGTPNERFHMVYSLYEAFFTSLLSIYKKEGYFPSSRDGEYPSGQAVVL